jgi:hypothetical protein
VIIKAYEGRGYDYFALSEHDLLFDPRSLQGSTPMVLLPAVEITSSCMKTLMYLGASEDLPPARMLNLGEVAEFVRSRGGLFIVDHPNYIGRSKKRMADIEELLAVEFDAVEIYTGVVERLEGSAYAIDIWDMLLAKGRRVFGHAVDDQHRDIDRFLGWNCVQWTGDSSPTPAGIIEALRRGQFYASTGVVIHSIGLDGDGRIVIESNADEVRWYVCNGRLAHVEDGGRGTMALDVLCDLPRSADPYVRLKSPRAAIYVRAELVGAKGSRAWSQPFFIEEAGQVARDSRGASDPVEARPMG